MADRSKDYPGFDASESEKIHLVRQARWHDFDSYYRPYEIQVEENLRFIAGRHWDVYIPALQRFENLRLNESGGEAESRQRPVFNWVGLWYMLTLAKSTENPPLFSFLPATEDRADHQLAEIFDPVHKYLWDELDVPHTIKLWMMWVVSSGRGILRSGWDPDAGDGEELTGPARIPLLDERGDIIVGPDGQPIIETVPDVPYQGIENDAGELQAVPMIEARPGGDFEITGSGMAIPPGQIELETISPIGVRTSGEPAEFHEKAWHTERSSMHVDEIKERFGVEIEPTSDSQGESNFIDRLFFGIGTIGGAMHRQHTAGINRRKEGFVDVYRMLEAPRTDVPQLQDGRELIVAGDKVLMDEPREHPERKEYFALDFLDLPGRPIGKTPLEDMIPVQKAYNRGWGQILGWRDLLGNPMWIVDTLSGVQSVKNIPGSTLRVRMRPGVDNPIQTADVADIPQAAFEIMDRLKGELQDLGSLHEGGSTGAVVNAGESGEYRKQLTYLDDRYLGPMLNRATEVLGYVLESWQPLLRDKWTDDRMVRVAGDSSVVRFQAVRAEMFKGRINVKPVPESMFPEGRDARQARLDQWLQQGIIGPETYRDLYRHPHLGRALKPGGVHGDMANKEHSQMLQGIQVAPIEAHDHEIHLAIHQEFRASPEYLDLPPSIQALFELHVQAHKIIMKRQMAQARAMAAEEAVDQAQVQGEVANRVAAAAGGNQSRPAGPQNGGRPAASTNGRP